MKVLFYFSLHISFALASVCGSMPNPPKGCSVRRCLYSKWEIVCEEKNCGRKPSLKPGCKLGPCLSSGWQQICDNIPCGKKPSLPKGCSVGECLNGNWQLVCPKKKTLLKKPLFKKSQ